MVHVLDRDAGSSTSATAALLSGTRRALAGIVVMTRLATLVITALSIGSGVQGGAYRDVPLAVAIYLLVLAAAVLVVWTALWGEYPVPAWVLASDVLVTAGAVVALRWAVTPCFLVTINGSDLEAIIVAVVIAVALNSSIARTVTASVVLAVAYGVAQSMVIHAADDVLSALNTVGWQVAAAWCCAVLTRRLRVAAALVDAATRQVVTQREQLAAQQERDRTFQEELRRYRAVHDGPLRILTMIAGPGPHRHPDPMIRSRCAISANVLRGTIPDNSRNRLTALSMALIKAGNDCAMDGLRVTYHFADLPDDLPTAVVDALAAATGEALANVARHAGTNEARLTARFEDGSPGATVTVAVVDQGAGFDPSATAWGYGICQSIIGRLVDVGGAATVDSYPGQGTRIDLRWPR